MRRLPPARLKSLIRLSQVKDQKHCLTRIPSISDLMTDLNQLKTWKSNTRRWDYLHTGLKQILEKEVSGSGFSQIFFKQGKRRIILLKPDKYRMRKRKRQNMSTLLACIHPHKKQQNREKL